MTKKQSFLRGASILGGAGIVIKLLGAAFKLPLGNLIGEAGMANFMAPYPLYNWLLVIAAAGIPTAIARLVAEREIEDDYNGAFRVVSVILKPLMLMSLVFFLAVFFGAPYIAKAVSIEDSKYAFRTIAPALLFVPIMAIYRGFFQGIQKLEAFAISQIIEQIFRVAVGLGLAFFFFSKGVKYAAAGATFGAAVGSFAGMVFMYFLFTYVKKNMFKEKLKNQTFKSTETDKEIMKRLLAIAIPITIGASIMPTMNSIDLILVVNRLKETVGVDSARSLYGVLTGFSVTVVNFPQILTSSLQISLVPAIAQLSVTYEKKKTKENLLNLSETIIAGIKTSLIIGLPCAVGLFVLADPVMFLLYPSRPAAALKGAEILRFLSWDLIFLALYQSTTGILQGMGKQMLPAKHLGVGLIFKVILTFTLVGMPTVGINGAAISTVVAFGVASILNVLSLSKLEYLKVNIVKIISKPAISALVMGLVVVLVYSPIENLLGHKLSTGLSILLGAFVYIIMILKTKTLNSREFDLLPGGSKLKKLAEKLG